MLRMQVAAPYPKFCESSSRPGNLNLNKHPPIHLLGSGLPMHSFFTHKKGGHTCSSCKTNHTFISHSAVQYGQKSTWHHTHDHYPLHSIWYVTENMAHYLAKNHKKRSLKKLICFPQTLDVLFTSQISTCWQGNEMQTWQWYYFLLRLSSMTTSEWQRA